MFPYTIRMYLQTLLFVFLSSLVNGQDRKIIPQLNPGCQSCTANNTLVYIKAIGSHDTIHQIWDFTRRLPTVIFAITSLQSTVNIHWDRNEADISISEDPLYCFAILIDKLYEYEDCRDQAHIDDECPRRELPLRGAAWTLEQSALSAREAAVRLRGAYRDARRSGVVDIKLDLLPFKGDGAELPHLIHSVNSTLVDVSLVNFTSTLNASRLAVHLLMTSTDPSSASMAYTMRKSLDDEHTPGVFEIIEIVTPHGGAGAGGAAGGFLQFRPVAYTEPARSVSSSTNAYVSPFNRTSVPARSTLGRFYRALRRDDVLAQDMCVSFGLTGDGYYLQHNYTSWSFTFGYGRAPAERVSLFVVVVISAGLGAPLLLALSGVVYVLARRRRPDNRPQRFVDDD